MNLSKLYLYYMIVIGSCMTVSMQAMETTKEELSPDQKALNSGLEKAIRHLNLEDAKEALNQGASVDAQTERGVPFIILASEMLFHPMVELLLEHGANINASFINEDGRIISPLYAGRFVKHGDARLASVEQVEWYMLHGANPNIQGNSDRITSLRRANGWDDVAKYLFSHGLRILKDDLNNASLLRMLHDLYGQTSLLFHIIAQESSQAQELLNALAKKAEDDLLTKEDVAIINEAFLLALAQDNNPIFDFILKNFANQLDLRRAFARAALVGNVYAVEQINRYLGNLENQSERKLWIDAFHRALYHAIIQRQTGTAAAILRIAAERQVNLQLGVMEQRITHILKRHGLTEEERAEYQYLLNLLQTQAGRMVLEPYARGPQESLLQTAFGRMPVELLAIILYFLTPALRPAHQQNPTL